MNEQLSKDFHGWPATQKISMNKQLIKRFLWMTSYWKYLYKLNCSASHTIIQNATPLTATVIKQIPDLNICTNVTAKNLTASLIYKEGNRFNLACTARQHTSSLLNCRACIQHCKLQQVLVSFYKKVPIFDWILWTETAVICI
jgi:hypothetical protein